mmetsp:Transcript_19805/g.51555  ORF Transcript_19805/g.51555 Transcript_19805/m.51555 type:complete len:263 (-) Transcript_19805:330-1118(-)
MAPKTASHQNVVSTDESSVTLPKMPLESDPPIPMHAAIAPCSTLARPEPTARSPTISTASTPNAPADSPSRNEIPRRLHGSETSAKSTPRKTIITVATVRVFRLPNLGIVAKTPEALATGIITTCATMVASDIPFLPSRGYARPKMIICSALSGSRSYACWILYPTLGSIGAFAKCHRTTIPRKISTFRCMKKRLMSIDLGGPSSWVGASSSSLAAVAALAPAAPSFLSPDASSWSMSRSRIELIDTMAATIAPAKTTKSGV